MDRLTSAIEYLMTPSAPVFIVGGLLVLLLPLLMHLWLTQSATYTTLPSILLAGPSGAGKTALLTLLERRTDPSETHTSQTPSTVELAISTNPATSSFRTDLDATGATATKFLLVDTPGHGKLRHHALSRLTPASASQHKLQAVVFVVDAAALSESGASSDALADTAAYLYDILLLLQKRAGATRSSKAPPAIAVLVAANKSDLFTALPAKLVKNGLEKELGRIRRSRSKGLLDSGVGSEDVGGVGGDEADDWLGEYGSEVFKFEQMREFDVYVDVEAGAVLGEKADVDRWWSWIGAKL